MIQYQIKKNRAYSVILSFVLWFFVCAAWGSEAVLQLRVAGKTMAEFSLTELQAELESHKVGFLNLFVNKEKNYQAFVIRDVLDFAYGAQWTSDEYSDIAFIALDGYEAVSSLDKLKEDGGFLAFRDLDLESGWEPLGYKKADPGPFFLFWTKEEQTTQHGYPWPCR